MFARAARFPAAKASDGPGPADYAPQSPANKLKRGAMLEKDERFRDEYKLGKATDTFGLYGTVDADLDLPPRPQGPAKNRNRAMSGPSSRSMAQPTTAQMELLERELSRAREQLALLPSLRDKFTALVSEHAASKTRYASNVSDLRTTVSKLESQMAAGTASEERLRVEGVAQRREVGRLGEEMGKLRTEKSSVEQYLKDARKEAERLQERLRSADDLMQATQEHHQQYVTSAVQQALTLCLHASTRIATIVEDAGRRSQTQQMQLLTSNYAQLRADRKASQAQDQVNHLVELVVALEDASQHRDRELHDAWMRIEQLEWDHARLSDARRQDSKHYRALLEEANEDAARLRAEMLENEESWELEREFFAFREDEADLLKLETDLLRADVEDLVREKLDLTTELAETKSALQAAREDMSARDLELEEKNERIFRLENTKEELAETLATHQADFKRAAAELASSQVQVQRLNNTITSLESGNLALDTEVATLQDELTDYHLLKETHEELQTALDRLMRTASLAEDDAAQLARLNAELAGHANPNQKIRHLERLRNDLAASKKKQVAVQSELSSALRTIENLQAEVAAYKTVDAQQLAERLGNSRSTHDLMTHGPGVANQGLARRSTLGDLKAAALSSRENNKMLAVPVLPHKNKPALGKTASRAVGGIR